MIFQKNLSSPKTFLSSLPDIDESSLQHINRAMTPVDFLFPMSRPLIVGSFGRAQELHSATLPLLQSTCDIAEIRLDLLCQEVSPVTVDAWQHLSAFPLLFTARRQDEGGSGNLSAIQRIELLQLSLHQAAMVDIEVASISEMQPLIMELKQRGIPWVASFHHFDSLPENAILCGAAKLAKNAGASIFKLAAKLHSPMDLSRLADFQLANHGIPVATMGMGSLAPVSRLLCAQCGSRLNYGYLGETPTAPGQWSASLLKQTIPALTPFAAV